MSGPPTKLRRSSRLARKDPPVKQLAALLREAKHCIFVTGAGISTNTGIRDYRGPDGVWTQLKKEGKKEGDPGIWDDCFYAAIPHAKPSVAHRGITALVEAGLCKFVISQNEDGLHVRSGLDRTKLAELHGNDYIELCAKCKTEITRDFVVYFRDTWRKTNPLGAHVTGRKCPEEGCGGDLLDLCVDFGEGPNGPPWGPNLVHNMTASNDHMKLTDLVVVWGSSLNVLANYWSPWDPLDPVEGRELPPCKMFIVNKGETFDEEYAVCKMEEDVDATMAALLQELDIQPPNYDVRGDPLLAKAVEPLAGEPVAPFRIERGDGEGGEGGGAGAPAADEAKEADENKSG